MIDYTSPPRKWWPWFAWYPIIYHDDNGIRHFIWLSVVFRTLDYNHDTHNTFWRYNKFNPDPFF